MSEDAQGQQLGEALWWAQGSSPAPSVCSCPQSPCCRGSQVGDEEAGSEGHPVFLDLDSGSSIILSVRLFSAILCGFCDFSSPTRD